MTTYHVRVTDRHGREIASADTSTRPTPPVEAVEAMFPALRDRPAYKVRITTVEDGRAREHGWDVDGYMVTLTG